MWGQDYAHPHPRTNALDSLLVGGVAVRLGGAVSEFTESDLRAMFRQAAQEAGKHHRCGPRSRCRVDALRWVDDVLDEVLELGMPNVHDAPPGAVTG